MVSFWQKVWVFSTFTLLNYLFYYCSLLVSFSTLVSPLPTLITCGFACWLITDTLFHWVATGRLWNLHCVIDMLLLLLWIVGMFVSEVRWLSLAILLRLKDILYVKELLFEMFKNNDLQFKAYVVAKILYWVLLVGHITGCLFYWIDQYTINN